MEIHDHILRAEGAERHDTPNCGGEIAPRFLVFHYTAGPSAESSVRWLCNPEARASAHLVIGRGGQIAQLAPFNVKTWHAGKSHWAGLSGLNAHSIGVEIDNAGRLARVGSEYRAWFQKTYPESEVVRARHKNESESAYWHAYTAAQIQTSLELAKLLTRVYALENILGHEDISPGRKSDPGPAFPMENIRSAALGRSEEEGDLLQVAASALNIRIGPGAGHALAGGPLPKGALLRLLEERDRWSLVEAEGREDLEGWVSNAYIRRA